jgi:DNA-binding transcriptional MerR regulator
MDDAKISKPESLTIGKLIKKLKKAYPDLTSSKLRFLESQGLINPKRSGNKYRTYFKEDIEKINFILKMQKEFYLPLDIIKRKIKSKEFKDYLDSGKDIKNLQLKLGEEFKQGGQHKDQYTIDEIKKKLKLSQSFIDELLDHDLVEWKNENGDLVINGSDIEIIKMAIELSKYGIHIKHLKLFENFAVRHSSFIQQIIMPLIISTKKDQHRKGRKVALLLERRLSDFHELLLKKENRKFLEKHK